MNFVAPLGLTNKFERDKIFTRLRGLHHKTTIEEG